MMLSYAVKSFQIISKCRSIIQVTTIRSLGTDITTIDNPQNIATSNKENESCDLRAKKIQSIINKHLPHSEITNATVQEMIEKRQISSSTPQVFANEKHGCKYGFTQAFVRYPVSSLGKQLGQLQSGMLRLSCPHLVKEIDIFEEEGGIDQINLILNGTKAKMSSDPAVNSNDISTSLSSTSPPSSTAATVVNPPTSSTYMNELQLKFTNNFKEVNRAWKDLRKDIMSEEEAAFVKSYLGEEAGDTFINSGIIGITQNRYDDAKCLHAHGKICVIICINILCFYVLLTAVSVVYHVCLLNCVCIIAVIYSFA